MVCRGMEVNRSLNILGRLDENICVVAGLTTTRTAQLDTREAQTKKSLDSGAAGMRALNERNKTHNVFTDTHVGRQKRLEEAKRR